MRIHAQYEFLNQCINLHIIDEERRYAAKPIAFEPLEEGRYIPSCLSLDTKNAQQLMDQLWQCGLRPSEGTGSAGALAATQNHLEDMRKIVFHNLGGSHATDR